MSCITQEAPNPTTWAPVRRAMLGMVPHTCNPVLREAEAEDHRPTASTSCLKEMQGPGCSSYWSTGPACKSEVLSSVSSPEKREKKKRRDRNRHTDSMGRRRHGLELSVHSRGKPRRHLGPAGPEPPTTETMSYVGERGLPSSVLSPHLCATPTQGPVAHAGDSASASR